ncbi:hypothetical protein HYT53_02955 [Candidatus Woesearchaeota archaeon]|nr:hypothetical protein [Candidatus Woesearchaeota archaeon]
MKAFLANQWYKFKRWFYSRENYEKHFNLHRFFMNLLYFIISVIVVAILYKNVDFFNQYTLIFFRIGSLLLLIGTYFIVSYLYNIIKQIQSKHYNLPNGYKAIIAILLIFLLIFIYNHSNLFTSTVKRTTDKISLSNFNPIASSKLIGSSNIVSPDAISSKLDFRRFTSFLPQPWGFLLFWGIIIAIALTFLSKFVFHGELPIWLVWILFIIGIIMIFQYKIPYNTVKVSGFNMKCNENNKIIVENSALGFGEMVVGMELSISCLEYKSSQCRPTCINKQPMCQCEANLIDLIFHQKGDWFLGG